MSGQELVRFRNRNRVHRFTAVFGRVTLLLACATVVAFLPSPSLANEDPLWNLGWRDTGKTAFSPDEPATAPGTDELPYYLRDRGRGAISPMFGTFIRRGELLVYPFYEFYRNPKEEYNPDEMDFKDPSGATVDEDFEGRYTAHEELIYLGYGITDWLNINAEIAWIQAWQEKDDDDPSVMPEKYHEAGHGDTEAAVICRFLEETEGRPELYGSVEIGFPFQHHRRLIGTMEWEYLLGVGALKGFGALGTFGARIFAEYSDGEVEVGEYTLEHIKRISPLFRTYVALEGDLDEIELITELQVFFTSNIYLKLNNAFVFPFEQGGVNWAPEVGVMFIIPLG